MNSTDDNTTKMLQAILNGQRALKEELIGKIDKLGARIDKLEIRIDKLEQRIDKLERNLTKRIDKIGLHLAYLDDDTPTREDHDKLVARVDKLEQQFTSV